EDLTDEDLNDVHFSEITDATFDFASASVSSDLDNLAVSNSDPMFLNLSTTASEQLIAFIDVEGKKGVLKLSLVDDGSDGDYFNSNDGIRFDMKVQP
ncbi:MAG: hypothetical protein AAF551_08205, partial [Bacteroidota bacterium]